MNDNVIEMAAVDTDTTVATLPPTPVTASFAPTPVGSSVTVGLTEEAMRAVTILASSIVFAAPAFATQANPQNIIALGDMFANFVKGTIKVQMPSDEAAAPPTNTTVFG